MLTARRSPTRRPRPPACSARRSQERRHASYRQSFEADCGDGTLRSVVVLGGDARVVPGGTTLSLAGGPPRDIGTTSRGTKGTRSRSSSHLLCQGASGVRQAQMKLIVEPGSVLGPIDGAKLEIRASGESVESNAVTTSVDDSRDPGNELEQARPIGEEALLTGHLSSASDSDSFSFTPSAGRTTISLAHLPADYDLVIYGPAVGPESTAIRRTAIRRTAIRRTPVGDQAEEPLDEAITAPDQLRTSRSAARTCRSVARRSTAARATRPPASSSGRRRPAPPSTPRWSATTARSTRTRSWFAAPTPAPRTRRSARRARSRPASRSRTHRTSRPRPRRCT